MAILVVETCPKDDKKGEDVWFAEAISLDLFDFHAAHCGAAGGHPGGDRHGPPSVEHLFGLHCRQHFAGTFFDSFFQNTAQLAFNLAQNRAVLPALYEEGG